MASNSKAKGSSESCTNRKRIYRANIFESRKNIRNKVNKEKLRILNNMLKNWYTRTKVPTCALTLLTTKDGTLVVKYSGPSIFEEFGLNEQVSKTFTDIVLRKMEEERIGIVGEGSECRSKENNCIDSVTMNILLSEDVLGYGVNEKRKLVTQIVTGHDRNQKQKWKKAAKPLWWPGDIEYRSPNERKQGFPSMSVNDMNKIISAAVEFVKALSGVSTNEVDEEQNSLEENFLEHNSLQHNSLEQKDHAPPDIATQGVTYVKDGQSLAVGIPYYEQNILHGHPIPSEHICVQILATNGNIPALCNLDGNFVEKLTLSVGSFYALPREDLRRNRLENGKLILESI